MIFRNKRTGRFTKTAEPVEVNPEDSIVAKFTEAVASRPTPPLRRWTWPVLLAVGLVAGCLAGAGWEYGAIQPEVGMLASSLERQDRLIKQAHEAFQSLFKADNRLEKTNDNLNQQNTAAQNFIKTEQDTRKAAAKYLNRGERILEDEQSKDELNNRERTAQALRLLKEAKDELAH